MLHLIDSTLCQWRVALFLVLSFCACTTRVVAQESVLLRQGVLDLRYHNLTDTALYLKGEVFFNWNRLLTPIDTIAPDETGVLFQNFPGTWNGREVGSATLGANGYGTYSFQILLPPNSHERELGLYVQDMYSAYRLFVNEKEVSANGVVGKSKEAYTPYWLPRFVSFQARSDTLNLLLQVANFHHSRGGISEPLFFGDADTVRADFRNDLAYDYILSGSLLMGGLFFLGLFFFGRDNRSLLYFSLFCLFFSYRVVGSVDYGFHHMFPGIPWVLSIRIEYLNMFAIGYFFVRYTRHLYPDEVSKLVIRLFSAIALVFFAITVVAPIHVFTRLPAAFFVVLLLFVAYCLWVYVSAIVHKRQGAIFTLLSAVVLFGSYGIEALDHFQAGHRQNLLFFITMAAFFFLQSLILSYRFAMSYKLAMYKAQEASRAKSEFLSVMSHEIRTPLNAVIGMSHLLNEKGPQQENISTLKIAAQNLLLLINNILDYTKIESGKVEFESLDTDLPELMEKLSKLHYPKALEDGLALSVTIDSTVPSYIVCDPTRLTQILSNLVGNGLKFTHDGYVKVQLDLVDKNEREATIRFSVEDSGIGIAQDKQEVIFDSFTQATRSVNRHYGGTGLGLPIIQKLLALQGSELHVKSVEGQGSTFWFVQTFSLGKGKREEPEKATIAFDEWDLLRGKRILLVEDNPVNVVIARKFLERWKVDVVVAMNGQEALGQDIDVDLILMDLQMPDIDGYTLTKMLRKRGVRIPILAFTASALFDARQKILASGMDDYVMKPFDPEELYQKLVKQLV